MSAMRLRYQLRRTFRYRMICTGRVICGVVLWVQSEVFVRVSYKVIVCEFQLNCSVSRMRCMRLPQWGRVLSVQWICSGLVRVDFNYGVSENGVAVVYMIVWVLGLDKKSEENHRFPPTIIRLFCEWTGRWCFCQVQCFCLDVPDLSVRHYPWVLDRWNLRRRVVSQYSKQLLMRYGIAHP